MKYYGTAYYPEQETKEGIERDIQLMLKAGFNVVRMGEFAWCRFEPKKGEYDLAWFDDVVEMLGKNGIKSLVCTPTANPPAWMVEKHPEILYRDNRGVVRPFGGRRHYCYNSPVYREYCRKIAAEMARRYGSSPYVIGFHIDNELAQEATGRCHCDTCREKFRRWLKDRYGSIENFNEKAGTIFWGQTCESFDQVGMPIRTIEPGAQQLIPTFYDNPTLRLDFERFCSDSLIEFQNIQVSAIREFSQKPITTNSTGIWTNGIDYYRSHKSLDVAAGDVYPSLRTDDMRPTSMEYGFYRGLKGKNFWVVETSSGGGHSVWAEQGTLQPFPGSLKQNAIHAFASGADLLTYFQFRSFSYGAEQLEAAVLDIDGIPRRRFKEFQEASEELRKLKGLLEESQIRNEVGICYDYDSHWALKIKPIHRDFSYQSQLIQIYSCLAGLGAGADLIPIGEEIRRYKLVIIPTPVIMSDSARELLKGYVADGGILITNFLAGIKGEYNTAPRESVPAGLTDLFGIRVAEGEPVFENTVSKIVLRMDGKQYTGRNYYWTESLEPIRAQITGLYADTFRAGETAVTQNDYGMGRAYYLGTWFDFKLLSQVFYHVLNAAGVSRAPIRLNHGTEVITRHYKERPVYFLFNYRQRKSSVVLEKKLKNVMNNETLSGRITLGPKEYLVLEEA